METVDIAVMGKKESCQKKLQWDTIFQLIHYELAISTSFVK